MIPNQEPKKEKLTTIWRKDILTGLRISLGIVLGLSLSGLLAVAVTGTVHTFSSGTPVSASQMNTNFTSLKTAIEGIVSSQWITNGANIGYTAGNVGIGTTSPGSKLTITQAGSTNTEGIRLVNGSVNSFLFSDSAGRLHLESNGFSNSLVIADSGNIGIGTNGPSEKLDLGGGNIKMGYTIVSGNDSSATGVIGINCGGSSFRVIGGGCLPFSTATATSTTCPMDPGSGSCTSNASNAYGWRCTFNTGNVGNIGYAICANIR